MCVNIHSVMLVQCCVGKLCKLSEHHKPEGAKEAVCPLLAPWFRLQCTDLAQASGIRYSKLMKQPLSLCLN